MSASLNCGAEADADRDRRRLLRDAKKTFGHIQSQNSESAELHRCTPTSATHSTALSISARYLYRAILRCLSVSAMAKAGGMCKPEERRYTEYCVASVIAAP